MRATVLTRPTDLNENILTLHPWVLRFGSVDASATCACCGSALTRHAAITETGEVLGVDCAVSKGYLMDRRKKPAARMVLSQSDIKLLSMYSDVITAAIHEMTAGRFDMNVLNDLRETKIPTYTLWSLAARIFGA